MLALHVTSLKQFMNQLLNAEVFDVFLLEEATITTAYTYQIDGHINKEFFTPEQLEDSNTCPYDFATWKSIRPLAFDLIKGKRTPLNFKFVLHIMPEHIPAILAKGSTSVTAQQIKALVLTVKYDGEKVTLLTGTAFHTFLPDKEPDLLWDSNLKSFLSKHEIAYEEL